MFSTVVGAGPRACPCLFDTFAEHLRATTGGLPLHTNTAFNAQRTLG